MAEGKNSFILYCDIIHTVRKLSREQAGDLFMHILEYVNDVKEMNDKGDLVLKEPKELFMQIAFEPIKQSLKRDLKKYEKSLDDKSKGAKVGNLKRWHPDLYELYINKEITLEKAVKLSKASEEIAPVTTEPEKEDKPKKTRTLFVRPKLPEIEAYCKERNNSVNAKKFFSHYESNGWMVGKNKMKNWKACVHKWEQDEKKEIAPVTNR